MSNEIVFTRAKLRLFRKAYEEARDAGDIHFMFEGHEVLVSYARYLIGYLYSELHERPPSDKGTTNDTTP